MLYHNKCGWAARDYLLPEKLQKSSLVNEEVYFTSHLPIKQVHKSSVEPAVHQHPTGIQDNKPISTNNQSTGSTNQVINYPPYQS